MPSTKDATIVISTGQTVDYCIISDTMKNLPRVAWIKKGSQVPAGTATAGSTPI